MYKNIIVILLFVYCGKVDAETYKYHVADEVLQNLYEANGNFIYEKPKLEIIKDDFIAAQYIRSDNLIELSEKAYRTCQSMGKDSLSALAFILAHELSHAYEDSKATSTNFLAYDHHHEGDTELEEAADIQGVFTAHLAGYKTVYILPEIINLIYKDFDLEANIEGYPSLSERQETISKVEKKSEELIRIYEAGTYLLAIGKYDLSVACFEYVEKSYKGREIYNNLGIAMTYLAKNYIKEEEEPYIFPLEVCWHTEMSKKLTTPSTKLELEERKRREEYLIKAETYLIQASKMNSEFITPDVNLLSVWILKGEYQKAIDYYNNQELMKKAEKLDQKYKTNQKQKVRLAYALANVYTGNDEVATRIWKDIKEEEKGLISYQASYNLRILEGEIIDIATEYFCPDIEYSTTQIDNREINNSNKGEKKITLSEEYNASVLISENNNTLTYNFKINGVPFTLVRGLNFDNININPQTLYNNMSFSTTNDFIIVVCPRLRIILFLNKKGQIIELIKYYP